MTDTRPNHTRDDLVTETSRLALEIDVAERKGRAVLEARLRVRFHTAMADLLALAMSDHPGAQTRTEQSRRDHLARAAAYRRELDQLEGANA